MERDRKRINVQQNILKVEPTFLLSKTDFVEAILIEYYGYKLFRVSSEKHELT